MTTEQILSYEAKGKTIRRSHHHKDMWIIDYHTGGFNTIMTSQEIMLVMNPPVSNVKYGRMQTVINYGN